MIRPSLYEVALWLVAEMFGGSNCCSLCGKRNRALTKEIAEHLRMGKTGRQEARGKAARLCIVAGPEWIGPCRAVPRHRLTVVDAARPHSARRFGHANLKSAIQVSPGKQTRMPHAKRERHFAHSVCDDLPVHFCIHCGLSSASSAGSSHRRVLALCSLPSRWELSSPVDPGGWIRALFLPPLLKSQGS